MKTITQTLIPDTQRLAFLPSKLGADCVVFEYVVFNLMDKYCEGYDGGYWQFYSLSNGGFFMALDEVRRFQVCNPDNYFEGDMSAEAASLGVCLFALNALAWQMRKDSLIEAYYALRDFAAEHPEAGQIMRFID